MTDDQSPDTTEEDREQREQARKAAEAVQGNLNEEPQGGQIITREEPAKKPAKAQPK